MENKHQLPAQKPSFWAGAFEKSAYGSIDVLFAGLLGGGPGDLKPLDSKAYSARLNALAEAFGVANDEVLESHQRAVLAVYDNGRASIREVRDTAQALAQWIEKHDNTLTWAADARAVRAALLASQDPAAIAFFATVAKQWTYEFLRDTPKTETKLAGGAPEPVKAGGGGAKPDDAARASGWSDRVDAQSQLIVDALSSSRDSALAVRREAFGKFISDQVGINPGGWLRGIGLDALGRLSVDEVKEVLEVWPHWLSFDVGVDDLSIIAEHLPRASRQQGLDMRKLLAGEVLPRVIGSQDWDFAKRCDVLEKMLSSDNGKAITPYQFEERLGLWRALGGDLNTEGPGARSDADDLMGCVRSGLSIIDGFNNAEWSRFAREGRAPSPKRGQKP